MIICKSSSHHIVLIGWDVEGLRELWTIQADVGPSSWDIHLDDKYISLTQGSPYIAKD